jgi:tetratricopeptide (TPR) repeat protein
MSYRIIRLRPLVAVLVLALALAACGKEPRQPSGVMDTPEHHYKSGMNFLDKGELELAEKEFALALELDDEYGPAMAGKGLAMAMRGEDDESLELIADGQDEADGKVERMWTMVAELRAHTALAKAGRIDEDTLVSRAEGVFDRARRIDKEDPALYFYMGEAYIRALRFAPAEDMFRTVLVLDRAYVDRAEERWELVQKVQRAEPRTSIGKRIALVDAISRADMAALLVEELNVERFYSRTQEYSSTFEPPKTEKPGQMEAPAATDIAEHPLRTDIELALQYDVMGLSAYPDHTFRPQKHLTRAEVAMILEDIIVRAMNKPELATRFFGQESPFSDVRGDHPYFNALMLVTTRGLMEADARTGRFHPQDPVPGVDAVLAISKLRSDLSVF